MSTLTWVDRPHGTRAVPRPRPTARARRAPTVRLLPWAAIVLAAFAAVVWRQTAAVERARELRALESELTLARSEAADLAARVDALESRGRIAALARARLGLRVPADSEVVLLEMPPTARGAEGR